MSLIKSRLTYLTLSFALFATAFPLISIGTSQGPAWLWWLGLGALIVGGMIPPFYRIISRSSTEAVPGDISDDELDNQNNVRR